MTDPRIEVAANLIADCDYPYYEPDLDFAKVVVEAIDKAATITTVEELDALPSETIVRTALDEACEKNGECWVFVGNECDFRASDVALPARVLYCGAE